MFQSRQTLTSLFRGTRRYTYSKDMSNKIDKDIQTIEGELLDDVSHKSQSINKKHSQRKLKSKDEGEAKEVLKEFGKFALKTAAISGAVMAGIAITVPLLGFTAGGVAAGSLAAAYQSTVLGGTIASGSVFATLQSVGAAGLAASTQAGIVGGSAVVSAGSSLLKKIKKNKKEADDQEMEEKEQKILDKETDTMQISKTKDVATQTD